MRGRSLLLLALAVVLVAGAAWWLLDRRSADAESEAGLLLPGFADRIEVIDRIEVFGAGDAPLVALARRDGRWRMPDRQDWPANQREISAALFRLGQARRIEPKTANPDLHARLGVESVAAADAKGARLRLSGGGEDVSLTIGNNHPSLGGSYVRVGDDVQTWLLDEDIAPARNPVDWLDRRLLDIPMARIDEVRVAPAGQREFRLSRVQDRFSLDGRPPSAMGNPDAGNTTAGFTDQLPFDDVAADDETAATQTVVFEGLDGVRITVAAWRGDEGTWARISAVLDEDRARAWIEQAASSGAGAEAEAPADSEAETTGAGVEERLDALSAQVAAWQAAFEGNRFLLPPYKAAPLMRSRNDYLTDSP